MEFLDPAAPRPCALRRCGVRLAIVASLLLLACGGESAPSRPNVVLIVLDTLRKDHLSAFEYGQPTSPRLLEFSQESVRYPRAYSLAPWTLPSIGALLSSVPPHAFGIVGERARLPEELVLVSERLRDAGYSTGAAVSHWFASSSVGFEQGFGFFDESAIPRRDHEVTGERVIDASLRFLEERDPDRPFFLFVHVFDPHFAYVEHPEMRFRGPMDYSGPVRSPVSIATLAPVRDRLRPVDVEEIRRIYLSEIAYTDAQVGRLLDALRARSLLDDTLVVVTADHGEEFLDHGRLGHGHSLYDELVNVPLIVRYPRRGASGPAPPPPGSTVDATVSLLDVVPTVLTVAGLDVPPEVHGHSLLDRPPDAPVFAETERPDPLEMVVQDGWKLIRRPGQGPLLFDLANDPEEQRNLRREQRPRMVKLGAQLDRWRDETPRQYEPAPPDELSEEKRELLRSLGYAE